MLSASEKVEALMYGFSLEELADYEGLEGFALVEDQRSGIQKVYSYGFARFLEDRGIVRILAAGRTAQELPKKPPKPQENSKAIKALERAEKLLKSRPRHEEMSLRPRRP